MGVSQHSIDAMSILNNQFSQHFSVNQYVIWISDFDLYFEPKFHFTRLSSDYDNSIFGGIPLANKNLKDEKEANEKKD